MKRAKNTIKIISWNINGIRACHRKGFADWLGKTDADIIGLQEVRAMPEQIPVELMTRPDWRGHLFPATRKGYSGVGLFFREKPNRIETSLGTADLSLPEFDEEGRLQIAYWDNLIVANVYFPNGSGRGDNGRVPYKLRFYKALFDKLQPALRGDTPAIVMGDFNTAHKEIDIARPKQNQHTSGFLLEEREELDRWLAAGWTDSFRQFDNSPDNYSWWSQRGGARERNVGWRIDYIYTNPSATQLLRQANIHTSTLGSDHCPISVTLASTTTT